MTFFASLVLVIVLVIRPQEIWPQLEALHLLEVLTGLVALGLLVDVTMGRLKYLYSPQLPFLAGFVVICYFVSALALGTARAITLGNNFGTIPALFMLAIMLGSPTLARLRVMVWTILLIGGFVAAVAVHQGSASPVCMERTLDDTGDRKPDIDTADGRVCGRPSDCIREGDWDTEWACERLGLFKTFSAAGRVRWRGQLDDPNELSVFIGAVIPLLFAVGLPIRNAASNRGPKQQKLAGTIAFAMIGVGLYAVILSQSRGGQLVIATVLALMFVARFGKKGLLVAAILTLPVLLLGGRDDADADESSMDRLELLTEGVTLVIAHPFRGVGVNQFADQVGSPLHLTAHNSYLLAAAETGFPGFFCWSGLMWTSLKIPLTALRTAALSAEIRAIATALLVSFSGIAVGIFFLSFNYKQLLFVWFGLSGAFYGIMRATDPTLRVDVGWKDCVGLVLADFGLIGLLYVYTRARGH
ncbi:MAG TPA: O-antigen ligase family protein [Polyangiaceae bacterium]